MHVGILTYHRSLNYGAVLQAYALKTFINELGHDTEIIDYWPKYHNNDYSFPRFNKEISFQGTLKLVIIFCFGFFRILKRKKRFQEFTSLHFNLSASPHYTTVESVNFDYDAIIYGSDQIWRKQDFIDFKGFNDIYFGKYASKSKIKISYAASMGAVNLIESDISYLREMIKNFNSISVREKELKNTIEKITNRRVSLVLDPVLLLDNKKWKELIPKSKIKKKYILLYQIISSRDSKILSRKLSKHHKLCIIETHGKVNPFLYGRKYKQAETPLGFLSLVANAEFIVTTSFHGAAFAVVFEKQFYALGMGKKSNRILTLLTSLGIENRYLNDITNINIVDTINYNNVKVKLKALKDNSILFLKNALHE